MYRWKNKKLDTKVKSKAFQHWSAYAMLSMSLLAMAFFGVCDPSMNTAVMPRGSAGRVAGEVISDLEFRRAYQSMYERYRAQLKDNFDPAQFKLSSTVLNQLVSQRVNYMTAKDLGVSVSEDEVIEMLRQQKAFQDEKGQFSPDFFERYLRQNVYTEKTFMESMQRDLTVQKFMELGSVASFVSDKNMELNYKLQNTKVDFEYLKFTPEQLSAAITPAQIAEYVEKNAKEIEEYYKANIAEFTQKEEVKARHILISFADARNASADAAKRTKEEAKKIAEGVLASVKKPGASFADIARLKTDEPSGKTSGGELGWFSRDKMVPEFSEAAFKLAKNEISGIVETPFGFHIIKAEDRKEPRTTTLEQAKTQIASRQIKEKDAPKLLEEKAQEYLTKLKAGENISRSLTQDKLSWQSTGEANLVANYVNGLGSDEAVLAKVFELQKPGELLPEVVGKDSKFIVRLKAKKAADMAKYDRSKEENQAKAAAYREATRLLQAMEQTQRKKLEDNGRIWLSKSHQNYDQAQQQTGG